jgi:uncharacterized protein (TIGR03435 family)
MAAAQTKGVPAFEVASVSPSVPLQTQISTGQLRIGATITDSRVDLKSTSLSELVALAYRLKPYQLTAPDWMLSERYDVMATIPAGASKEQVPEMMQTLLAERFKLRVHTDKKEQSVYALIVGTDGHKLKSSEPAPSAPAEPEPGAQSVEFAGQKIQMGANGESATVSGPDGQTVRVSQADGRMRMEFGRVSMAQFAETISRFVDRPVVDATGLTGTYQVPLELRQEDLMAMVMVQARAAGVSLPVGALPGATPGQAAEPASSSIFESVQKLGLKLDSRKMPVDMIVVDSAERKPTDN